LWCGLPIICYPNTTLADTIEPDQAGWCLDPNDPTAMADLFDRLLTQPEVLVQPARQARRLAQERLNWETAVAPLDRFIRMPFKRDHSLAVPLMPELVGDTSVTQVPAVPPAQPAAVARKGLAQLIKEARRHYQRGGLRILSIETLAFLQRQIEHH
jgi:hypothetical protein